MDKGGRGGGQPMWIIIKFYNIIIKSANGDKGGGGKTLIHKMLLKILFFKPFPNRASKCNLQPFSKKQPFARSSTTFFL